MRTLHRLPSGVRVAFDPVASVRSCSIGFWLEAGSANERPEEAGLAHFLEHMLFKGTKRHDVLALADEMNRLGGNFNAMTNQETICLHTQCVDLKAPDSIELLAEMLLDSTFPEAEIARERNVILEEYKMYEDTPDDLVVDLYMRRLWPASPMGRPVIGSPAAIARFSRPMVGRFLSREFAPARLLVVIAGSYDRAKCEKVLKARLGKLRAAGRKAPEIRHAKGRAERGYTARPVEQVHFCFGGASPSRTSPDRFAFGLLNLVLGGGMSSRLFREVREKRGLAYSIQSFQQPFRRVGCYGVAGSTSPDTAAQVIDISRTEMARLCRELVPERELELAKEQVRDSFLMSLESTMSRMTRLADAILNFGKPVPHEEILRRMNAVTPAHVLSAARKYLGAKPLAAAVIGPKNLSRRLMSRF